MGRIIDQGLDLRVFIEADAHLNLAVRQANLGQPTCTSLLLLEFLGVHENDEARLRRHGRDRPAPAKVFGPKTAVTHLATHDKIHCDGG